MQNDPRRIGPAILALCLGSFAIGTSEFAAMGLLPWFAAELGVTEPQAGHVISAYALGVVIGAPLTTLLGARLPRRRYLAALIAFYGLMNLAAAVLPGYSALAISRFAAGLPHGGFLGVATLVAADALPKAQRAKGVAQVILGLTIANIVGVPLAGVLGQGLGWRWGFALPGGLALISAVLILRLVPRVGVDPNARPLSELKALANPAVLLILLVGAIGSGGFFAVYAYLSAAMLATSAPPSWAIPLTLAVCGLGMTFGNLLAAPLTVRLGPFRALLVLFSAGIVMQLGASLAVGSWPAMMLSVLMMGLACGAVVPIQTRLMDVAGEAQSMAAAMNHAAFNLANALGPFLAGLALNAGLGWRSSGVVGAGLSVLGILALGLAALQARRPALARI